MVAAGGGGGATTHCQITSSAGGSSFISGYLGCNSITEASTENNIVHTGQANHYSGYVFKDGMMRSGNEEMPNYASSGTMIGNSGNGYARISLIYYYN